MAFKTKKATTKKLKSSKLRFFKTRNGILAIVVVLAIAGIGGYKVYKSKAANYTYLGTSTRGVSVWACKTYAPVYGGVYTVNVLYIKAKSTQGQSYGLINYRGNSRGVYATSVKSGKGWLSGTTGGLSVTSSAYYGDTISASMVQNGWAYWDTGLRNPKNFGNC